MQGGVYPVLGVQQSEWPVHRLRGGPFPAGRGLRLPGHFRRQLHPVRELLLCPVQERLLPLQLLVRAHRPSLHFLQLFLQYLPGLLE